MHPKIEAALEIVQRMEGYLASVLYAMDGILVENLSFPALTNYRVVKVDKKYLEECSVDDLAFLLAHEAGHIIGKHDLRCGNRDQFRWNMAGDKAINRALSKRLPFSDMKSIPVDDSATPLSEEELYDQDKSKGSGECRCYVPRDDSAQTKAIAKRIQAIVERAKAAGKGLGIEGFIPPEDARLPLPRLAANIMAKGRDDYSWRKPSRVSRLTGIYSPSLSVKALAGTVMIAVDTSGSMPEKEIARGIGGIQRAAKAARIERLVVVQHDSEAQVIYDGAPIAYKHSKMRVGGGTDFRPVMALAQKIKPRLLVCITDLEGPHGQNPGCRVVWVTSTQTYQAPPFGAVCRW